RGFGSVEAPWVTTGASGSGGWMIYAPIPFQNSITLGADCPRDWDFYYQVDWRALPLGTQVSSFSGAFTADQQAALTSARRWFTEQQPGELLASEDVTEQTALVLEGPAIVREIRLDGNDDLLSGQTSLALSIDDGPSSQGPVDQLFGAEVPGSAFDSAAFS